MEYTFFAVNQANCKIVRRCFFSQADCVFDFQSVIPTLENRKNRSISCKLVSNLSAVIASGARDFARILILKLSQALFLSF